MALALALLAVPGVEAQTRRPWPAQRQSQPRPQPQRQPQYRPRPQPRPSYSQPRAYRPPAPAPKASRPKPFRETPQQRARQAKSAISKGIASPWFGRSSAKGPVTVTGRGFIYQRVVRNARGRVIDTYRGQSKNEKAFIRRQSAHTGKMKKQYGKDVSVSFQVLGRYRTDGLALQKKALRVAEETHIRKGLSQGLGLTNDIRAMKAGEYRSLGGRR